MWHTVLLHIYYNYSVSDYVITLLLNLYIFQASMMHHTIRLTEYMWSWIIIWPAHLITPQPYGMIPWYDTYQINGDSYELSFYCKVVELNKVTIFRTKSKNLSHKLTMLQHCKKHASEVWCSCPFSPGSGREGMSTTPDATAQYHACAIPCLRNIMPAQYHACAIPRLRNIMSNITAQHHAQYCV